jgi:chromosome segregation ATPase
MTLQEIERSFQVHQERMARIDERLDRMAAEAEGHERRLKRIEDNLIVQGEILNRVDQRLDRMAARVENHDQQLAVMQSAMTSLFQRMDAFIRGLERGNGDTPAGGPR